MTRQPISGLNAGGVLATGAKLGPYEVLSPLGAGGMGEVYRARDTRLGREVAIKVLGRFASADPARRQRFDREARLASAVSHPNVLTVFDVGEWEDLPYVVTELLEGETLRGQLRLGALGARQAVGFAIQVAQGLAALHARGIVHRDLKPENIFVTSDGRLKILDLGLAGPSREGEGASTEPWETLTTEGSAVGGTAAYMSPEQVRRLPADPRSDVFACGVVLYEMLGRRRPFQEETAAETMTAILRRDPPPLASLDATLPPTLVRVVERCLAKRPDDRFHSAHDLALALEASLEPAPPLAPAALPAGAPAALAPALSPKKDAPAKLRGQDRAAKLLILFVLAALGAWIWKAAAARPVVEPALASGPAVLVGYNPKEGQFAPFMQGIAADGVDFSRDGTWATFTSYPAGILWRSRLDGSDRRALTHAPLRAGLPRFSPDGRWIAFAARVKDGPWQIHLVSSDGGSEETLAPLAVTDPGWEPDGKALVFGPAFGGPAGIFRWDFTSRQKAMVRGSEELFSPRPSPDGRFLAAIHKDTSRLYVRDALTGQWSPLTSDAATYPAWTRDGAWLHFRRMGAGAGFFRVDPRTGREERVSAVEESAMAAGEEWGAWSALTPDGWPLMLFDLRRRKGDLHSPLAYAERRPQWAAVGADQRGVAVRVETREPDQRKTSR